MSRALGFGVLIVGLGALGWWSWASLGPKIEQDVSAKANAVVENVTRHPVAVRVGGRDIIVSGLAHDPAERDLIVSRLSEVPGHRVVSTDLTVLPQVVDYQFTAEKSEDGTIVASGYVPDQATADLIQDVFADADVTLASGEPGPTWGGAVLAGLQGLGALDAGKLDVSADTIELTGGPNTPELVAMMDTLPVPAEYELALNLETPEAQEEAPPPYEFTASKDAAGRISVTGLVPDQSTADSVGRLDGVFGVVQVVPEGVPNAAWSSQVQTGLAALDELNAGRLDISQAGVRLSGNVSSVEAFERIEGLADTAPGGIDLAAISMPPPEPAEPEQVDTTPAAPAPDLPKPAELAQLSYTFDANIGVIVEASMPEGVDYSAVQDAIGAKRVLGNVIVGSGGNARDILANASVASRWLSEFETAALDLNAPVPTFRGRAHSDVDAPALAEIIRAENPGMNVTVRSTTKTFAQGTERADHVLGGTVIHKNGYWVPLADFPVSERQCQAEVNAVQRDQKIDFESGSAVLAPASRPSIARLAGIIDHCLNGTPFVVSVDGYTDNRGGAEDNIALSQERAKTVADGLTARGIDANLLTTNGYGADNPIASNGTASGRAANRRTEIRIRRQ